MRIGYLYWDIQFYLGSEHLLHVYIMLGYGDK